MREWITDTHVNGLDKSNLHRLLPTLTNNRKIDNYTTILDGYSRWWGAKQLTWFAPPVSIHASHNIEVSVNPELGLQVDQQPHLIKLYFKADPLTKAKTEVITHLMETSLRPLCAANCRMSVLDIRKSKLYTPTVPVPNLNAMLDAELAYLEAFLTTAQNP